MIVTYIVGLPGSGKTTSLAKAYERLGWTATQQEEPIPHLSLAGAPTPVIELGRRREGGFSGTDALAMNINPQAIDFVEKLAQTDTHVIAEGDRLSNERFLNTCRLFAANFRVVWVDTSLDEAQNRMTARAVALGREPQSRTWWKGRHTRVTNVTTRWADYLNRVDGNATPDEIAETLAEHLNRVAQNVG